jgi:hypothetical protein
VNALAVDHEIDGIAEVAIGQAFGRDPVLGDLIGRSKLAKSPGDRAVKSAET